MGFRRKDDYRFGVIPPGPWIRDMHIRITLDNWRRWRRQHQWAVLRAVAITLSVLVAGAYLVVMPMLAWISSGFGLAVSGRIPLPHYHSRAE